jgi:hypothetical protein
MLYCHIPTGIVHYLYYGSWIAKIIAPKVESGIGTPRVGISVKLGFPGRYFGTNFPIFLEAR